MQTSLLGQGLLREAGLETPRADLHPEVRQALFEPLLPRSPHTGIQREVMTLSRQSQSSVAAGPQSREGRRFRSGCQPWPKGRPPGDIRFALGLEEVPQAFLDRADFALAKAVAKIACVRRGWMTTAQLSQYTWTVVEEPGDTGVDNARRLFVYFKYNSSTL